MQAEDGEDGDEGVGECVAIDDSPLGEALGAGGADVVLAQLFEHGGAHHAGEDPGKAEAQGDGREDEVEPELRAEDGAGTGSGDGRPAEVDGKNEDEDGSEPRSWGNERPPARPRRGRGRPASAVERGDDAGGDGDGDPDEKRGEGEGRA